MENIRAPTEIEYSEKKNDLNVLTNNAALTKLKAECCP